jgi:signal transduction histidine kinase
MTAQIDKLITLVADLLDVTKLSSGEIAFTITQFDVSDLVHEIAGDIALTTSTHSIDVIADKPSCVVGDRDRVGRVLTNLFVNAIKYSPRGRKIIARVSFQDHFATVSVQDFGIGIPSSHLQKIFERFYRISEPAGDSYPGLGLGLYISAQIILRLHGKIWVESTEGKGSTFYFSLPLAAC